MKKLAIFVEGRSELLFIDKFLKEFAGEQQLIIEQRSISGGVTVPKKMERLNIVRQATNEKYYVLLLDCQGDSQVANRVREEQVNLTKAGYDKIIGIRDVRPNYTKADIPRLRQGLEYGIKTVNHAQVCFILATMEFETWLLAEHSHFQRVNSILTPEYVLEKIGFHPNNGDLSDRTEPAKDLNAIYNLGGKDYIKGNEHTINIIDMEEFYLNVSNRISDVADLKQCLEDFFI